MIKYRKSNSPKSRKVLLYFFEILECRNEYLTWFSYRWLFENVSDIVSLSDLINGLSRLARFPVAIIRQY